MKNHFHTSSPDLEFIESFWDVPKIDQKLIHLLMEITSSHLFALHFRYFAHTPCNHY